MSAGKEHLERLRAARIQTVEGRRKVAARLAEDYQEGHAEELRELFVELQTTIEAIDRAIEDEQRQAKQADGQAPAGFMTRP
ncbi:MAG TPA: hypothetical protein VMU69_08025 [Bradyrhizobium sp.]|nr:hypothetical protein [Bradyrhizobium sp.]